MTSFGKTHREERDDESNWNRGMFSTPSRVDLSTSSARYRPQEMRHRSSLRGVKLSSISFWMMVLKVLPGYTCTLLKVKGSRWSLLFNL
jgi:hypothetical protein